MSNRRVQPTSHLTYTATLTEGMANTGYHHKAKAIVTKYSILALLDHTKPGAHACGFCLNSHLVTLVYYHNVISARTWAVKCQQMIVL